ncbi:MAG TPA: hypothetical protein VGY56_19895 [Verrucomicrobiae bacterium]|nr:hypothetical protein [Verrucomicrobiae bacterium]
MNTTTNLRNSMMENPSDSVSTLDQDKIEHASMGTGISARPRAARKWTSGTARSAWADAWTLRGIPELDSPMAG